MVIKRKLFDLKLIPKKFLELYFVHSKKQKFDNNTIDDL